MWPNLSELRLVAAFMQGSDTVKLMRALKACSQLRRLVIKLSTVTVEAVSALADGLNERCFPYLETLSLIATGKSGI